MGIMGWKGCSHAVFFYVLWNQGEVAKLRYRLATIQLNSGEGFKGLKGLLLILGQLVFRLIDWVKCITGECSPMSTFHLGNSITLRLSILDSYLDNPVLWCLLRFQPGTVQSLYSQHKPQTITHAPLKHIDRKSEGLNENWWENATLSINAFPLKHHPSLVIGHIPNAIYFYNIVDKKENLNLIRMFTTNKLNQNRLGEFGSWGLS